MWPDEDPAFHAIRTRRFSVASLAIGAGPLPLLPDAILSVRAAGFEVVRFQDEQSRLIDGVVGRGVLNWGLSLLPGGGNPIRVNATPRRDGRVVEGARLESVYRGNSIEGSNPSLSAMLNCQTRPANREPVASGIPTAG